MNNSDKAFVETLTRSQIFRDYETAFREAVGLPLAFTPPETWGLPLHENINENPFCRAMARCNKSCAACLQVQESLRLSARDSTNTETCAFGLRDSAVPVKIGNRLVGFLRTGQVFTRKPTEDDFAKTIATLQELGAAVKADELRDDYFAGRIVTAEQYAAILRLLEVFAQHLGTVSNQILVAEETAENPQITRAKDFIAENIADDIGLSDCASAAHMSTFYFCKMFKKATGLSFTEYLSRLRTEKAKARLLDPHVRVSEVAFEVGFQSLSQFNRVFKSVTGLSPSEYRRSLPAHAVLSGRSTAEPASETRPFRFGVNASSPRSSGRLAGVAAR
jgi:AraC-like DNA-binding protein/ligand-binding sensor protein